MENGRSGRMVRQQSNYSAFIPNPLPPDPPILFDSSLIESLSKADRYLGRLDGVTQILPNPDLFVAMYVRKEAVLSSQIEGTQASLIDILNIDGQTHVEPQDVEEVVNYVHAMKYGLSRLETLPLSLRLLKEIHGTLMDGVRGGDKSPGEFRRSQNWIGPAGCSLTTASFVPPPPLEMEKAMNELELFLYIESELLPLIRIGLIHAQFETIHPFLDGNGRMGRLLITFFLCQQKVLIKPLLYLSHYFKKNREEYYGKLTRIRTHDDWEGWLKFFLNGVAEVADEAFILARGIIDLQQRMQVRIREVYPGNINAFHLLAKLFEQPVVDIRQVQKVIGTTYPTASSLVKGFESLGILKKIGEKQRYRRYIFADYVNMMQEGTEL
jgi:Fic family protein